MPWRSINSSNFCGVHLNDIPPPPSAPVTQNIFAPTEKQRSALHLISSVAPGNERQYLRSCSMFTEVIGSFFRLARWIYRFDRFAAGTQRFNYRFGESFRGYIAVPSRNFARCKKNLGTAVDNRIPVIPSEKVMRNSDLEICELRILDDNKFPFCKFRSLHQSSFHHLVLYVRRAVIVYV